MAQEKLATLSPREGSIIPAMIIEANPISKLVL